MFVILLVPIITLVLLLCVLNLIVLKETVNDSGKGLLNVFVVAFYILGCYLFFSERLFDVLMVLDVIMFLLLVGLIMSKLRKRFKKDEIT